MSSRCSTWQKLEHRTRVLAWFGMPLDVSGHPAGNGVMGWQVSCRMVQAAAYQPPRKHHQGGARWGKPFAVCKMQNKHPTAATQAVGVRSAVDFAYQAGRLRPPSSCFSRLAVSNSPP